jgi:hypothetical protein
VRSARSAAREAAAEKREISARQGKEPEDKRKENTNQESKKI